MADPNKHNSSERNKDIVGCLVVCGIIIVLLFLAFFVVAPYDPDKRGEYRPPAMGGGYVPGEAPESP